MSIQSIAYIEMAVSNLPLTVYYFTQALGFSVLPDSRIEQSGVVSVVLFQMTEVVIILSSPLDRENSLQKEIYKRGDFVKEIGFGVEDVEKSYATALSAGATPVEPVCEMEKGFGSIQCCKIKILEEAASYVFLKEGVLKEKFNNNKNKQTSVFNSIDHIALCVPADNLELWVSTYERIFGFNRCYQSDIDTGKTGMYSMVVRSENGKAKVVMTSPMLKKNLSQIDIFLKYNCGPGVQHIAFDTNNILSAVAYLKDNGVSFLTPPKKYYETIVNEKIGEIINDKDLIGNGILVDGDEQKYLFQIFSLPIQTRPTFFFEVIQRAGCESFGGKNVRRLFEAIEAEMSV